MNKFISGILLVSIFASCINAKMIRVDSKNIVYDTDTNLFWQDDSDSLSIKKNWNDAVSYCENLSVGGYNDWKLPDAENNTLFDLLEKTYAFKNFSLETYWSSSESTQKENAWIVNFERKSTFKDSKNNIFNVKCIRFGQENDLLSFASDIKKVIQEEIQKKTESERDDKAWELAQKENSMEAYKDYLKQFQNGKYTKFANENLAEKLKKLDKETWNRASSQNTIPAYKDYLKQFSNGEYASSAKYEIEKIEKENNYSAILNSKNPQKMYLEAVKYENAGERGRAKKVYLTIMDKFENNAVALKAADRLAALSDVEAVESSNRETVRAVERSAEKATSSRRNQSRQECENNKNACFAGCGSYMSDAPNHNYQVGQCRNQCERISCY